MNWFFYFPARREWLMLRGKIYLYLKVFPFVMVFKYDLFFAGHKVYGQIRIMRICMMRKKIKYE